MHNGVLGDQRVGLLCLGTWWTGPVKVNHKSKFEAVYKIKSKYLLCIQSKAFSQSCREPRRTLLLKLSAAKGRRMRIFKCKVDYKSRTYFLWCSAPRNEDIVWRPKKCRYQPFLFDDWGRRYYICSIKCKKKKKKEKEQKILGTSFPATNTFHFLASAFFFFAILEMHEGAHFTVINACETQFTCCSPDGDTGAYHRPHAWLMRVTAVIFKTWGSFWLWLRFVIFIFGQTG